MGREKKGVFGSHLGALQGIRTHCRKGLCGTKPGLLLRERIPIRTGFGDAERPVMCLRILDRYVVVGKLLNGNIHSFII
jgi:hypothetical protein